MANTNPWPSSGAVGIGTTSPATDLQLQDTNVEIGMASGSDTHAYTRLGMTNAYDTYWGSNVTWNGSAFAYVAASGWGGRASWIDQINGTIQFMTVNGSTFPTTLPAPRLFIDTTANYGYVGVGTASPAAQLDVNGTVHVTSLSGGGLVTSAAGVLAVSTVLPTSAMPALTGDVSNATGTLATTISANAVSNSKLAQMAAKTIKGNNSSAAANAADIGILQARLLLAEATVFNVLDYGADPTGAAYSDAAFFGAAGTGAFGSAIASNQRFKIRIPAGTYKLKTSYAAVLGNVSDGFAIEGDGAGSTILRWDAGLAAGNSGITISLVSGQGNFPNASPFVIKGFSMVTQTNNNGDAAIYLKMPDTASQSAFSFFENLGFNQDTTGTLWCLGIKVDNPQWLKFKDLMVNCVAGILANITGTTSMDGLWFDKCYVDTSSGYCLDFESTGSGFQTLVISDCALIAGTDCVHASMAGAGGGAEDWVIRDSYINNRGSGSWAVNINSVARIWVHDCFCDYTSGMAGCVKIYNSEQNKIHHNLFSGGGGTETALNIDQSSAGKIDSNEFSNFAHDITLGANASTHLCVQNQYLNGPSTNYVRNPVISDSGFRNLFDIPTTVSKIPPVADVPVGFRGFVSDATATTFGSILAGSGTNYVPWYCDGTNLRIG